MRELTTLEKILIGVLVVLLGLGAFLLFRPKTDYNKMLQEGIQSNKLSKVETALNNGADANMTINGTSALVQAIKQITPSHSDPSIANALISAGADIMNSEVIITAMRKGSSGVHISDYSVDFLPSLISLGVDVNTKIDGVNDVYCYAVKMNMNPRVVSASVAGGANVNGHIDGEPYNALEHVIRTGMHNMVSTLVRLGAEPPESIDGVPLRQYVFSKYGQAVIDAFYSNLFK